VICKGELESLPAVMAVAIVLRELGYDLEVITSKSQNQTKVSFAEKGINIIDIIPEIVQPRSSIPKKAYVWKTFSKRVWYHIDRSEKNTLLWIASADTALALGKRLLRRRYVLQIRELYDNNSFYRKHLRAYAKKAGCVVVPEICRAAIFRSWYGLNQTPVVLPNRPADHPRQKKLKVDNEHAKAALKLLGPEDKIVLYQGHVGSDRDFRPVVETVSELGEDWRFVAMGPAHGDYLDRLRESCPKVIYLPRVIPPFYLQITSHAFIGVVTYSWGTLNNVFCAPNKVWEYSGFGIPMICSDMPALQFLVQTNNAGICVDMADRGKIESAFRMIDDNYAVYSSAASQLYDSVNIGAVIQHIIGNTGYA